MFIGTISKGITASVSSLRSQAVEALEAARWRHPALQLDKNILKLKNIYSSPAVEAGGHEAAALHPTSANPRPLHLHGQQLHTRLTNITDTENI